MSFCPHCGTEIKSNANSCIVCGQRVDSNSEPGINNNSNQPNAVKPKRKHLKPILIAIVILLVIVNIILGVTLITKNNITKKDAPVTVVDKETQVSNSTDENTYTGTIQFDGVICCLRLDEKRSITYAEDKSPITTDTIWIGETDIKSFSNYNGMRVTLKGELFNYRDGGTLMFENTPIIVSSAGTAQEVLKSSTYENWDNVDNATKLRDAGNVLKMILSRCDKVESVKVAQKQTVLDDVNVNGFDYFNRVLVAINGIWMEDYEFEVFITPTKEYIYIYFGTQNAPDIPCFTYTWNGEFINGYMLLEEYIVQEGLAS